MRVNRYLTGVALAILAMSTQAQAPFQIHGLHPDLGFAEALAAVEKLGGQCRIKHSRSDGGGVSAQCALVRTGEPDPARDAGQPGSPPPSLMIGSQPITRIGIEAPVESAQLVRIVFMFDGSLDVVAEYLVQEFGKPDHDGTTTEEASWSHSRRRSWRAGDYTMGLLNSPDLVILAVHRPPPDPDAR